MFSLFKIESLSDELLVTSQWEPFTSQPIYVRSSLSFEGEKSFTETVSSAFSVVADLVRPGSKRKLQESDVSFTSETTAVMEEEDLITFDYQHYDADSPSTKSVNGSGMNLVNLQFNTLNVIGKI